MKLLRKNESKITKNENDEMYKLLIYKLLKEYYSIAILSLINISNIKSLVYICT